MDGMSSTLVMFPFSWEDMACKLIQYHEYLMLLYFIAGVQPQHVRADTKLLRQKSLVY